MSIYGITVQMFTKTLQLIPYTGQMVQAKINMLLIKITDLKSKHIHFVLLL